LSARWRGRFVGRLRSPSEAGVAAALGHALVCVLDDDLAGAEAPLAAVVERDSRRVAAYLALGRLFRRRGDVGRAIRVHQNLLLRSDLTSEERILALRGLAADLHRGGFLQRAADTYDELLARRPRDACALRARIELHRAAGSPERALPLVARLHRIEGAPDAEGARRAEAALWLEAAELAQREGRARDARRAVRRALRRSPTLAAAWALLGELEAERGRSKRALAAWREACSDAGAGLEEALLGRLRSAFAAVGRADEYPGFLRERLRERPDESATRLELASVLAGRGDPRGAEEELRELLRRSPGERDAALALGRLLADERRFEEACAAYAALGEAQHAAEAAG
jgi:lipopolysaccharide biosynthesis regulator YciM